METLISSWRVGSSKLTPGSQIKPGAELKFKGQEGSATKIAGPFVFSACRGKLNAQDLDLTTYENKKPRDTLNVAGLLLSRELFDCRMKPARTRWLE